MVFAETSPDADNLAHFLRSAKLSMTRISNTTRYQARLPSDSATRLERTSPTKSASEYRWKPQLVCGTQLHAQDFVACPKIISVKTQEIRTILCSRMNLHGNGPRDHDASIGAAVYSPAALAVYDLFVLGFSNSFAWNCPSRLILDLYDRHVSSKHLDIGVGTGYFMNSCRFPPSPTIALLDLNPNCLEKAAARLRRYAPTCHVGNVLQPIDIGSSGFGSIGLNYLLHCLPGDLKSKSIVFHNVKPLLKDGGVIFGSTILGRGVKHNFLARKLMRAYNSRGIFNNLYDSQEDLEAGLRANFNQCTIGIRGCVALFNAKN